LLGEFRGGSLIVLRQGSLELFFKVMGAIGVLCSLVERPAELGRYRFEFGFMLSHGELKITQAVLAGMRGIVLGLDP
jgi:hypothetical protein